MMTREVLLAEMARSEGNEERTYKELTRNLFRGLQASLKALYDEMAAATFQLAAITARAIQDKPKTIKILRYCLAPVISQMRLGQIIDMDSTPAEVEAALEKIRTAPVDAVATEESGEPQGPQEG